VIVSRSGRPTASALPFSRIATAPTSCMSFGWTPARPRNLRTSNKRRRESTGRQTVK
jgi:hypothetical protein